MIMPFTKISPNKYKSPSGKIFTKKQVKLYHATDFEPSKLKLKKQWRKKGAK